MKTVSLNAQHFFAEEVSELPLHAACEDIEALLTSKRYRPHEVPYQLGYPESSWADETLDAWRPQREAEMESLRAAAVEAQQRALEQEAAMQAEREEVNAEIEDMREQLCLGMAE